MTCAACGTNNRAGAKFCIECGTALAATCPSCGAAVDAGAKFCPECGTRLTPPGPVAPRTASPEAADLAQEVATERRLVTVLFADLVGFTSLAESRDAESVRDLLTRYFDRATEIVNRYGGTVEKFIGDAVMAVWGTPVTHEDDPERAVRAALDLVDAVRELGGAAGVGDLQARAGVMTGEAAVSIGAQNQGMVAGDLVNTASRLQALAAPGTVLVGEATRRAAEGAIAFEPAGEHALKGKSLPVVAFRALRVVATVGGTVRADALEPPFVGRDTEFRLLREFFHATGRDRRARLVSLTGQAGIGKSRLAWEFQKYLDGISEPLWWHHGRSPAYGEGVTFWALGEMIRKRAGLAEADDDELSRARIAETVADHVSDEKERAFVEPALLTLLGLDEPPPGGRDRLFAGWRLFLERLSASSTVVLVFEDVQWADDGLLDFIEHLMEWSRSYPILVVTLARPELLDRRPTWAAAARSASSLALGPLDEQEMRDLLAGLVPGLPDAAVRSILRRADGIPLYAVETVRMLVADGRLEPVGDGRFRPTDRLDELEVPTTLQALIAARLDGLDPADRGLLQDASVLGKTFNVDALAAVAGADADELAGRLRSLVARELLSLDTDPASPERGQYGFVQALIREVAYGTLSRRDRRTRHLAAARFFEARGDEETAPVLASHYLDAYRAAPDGPEGEAVGAQARVALRAAAERAMSLGSYTSAMTYYEQALEVGTGNAAEDGELLLRAGAAADLGGRYERAIDLLSRAVERWRAAGDSARVGHATAALGLALADNGQGDEAIELLEAARAEFDDAQHEVARAPVVARIGQIYVRRGVGQPALEAAEEVLPIAERHRMEELFVDALITKSAAISHTGRPLEAAVLIDGAMRIARERGLVDLQMRALVNGVVQRIDEDPWRAYELAQESMEEAARYGIRGTLVICALNLCELAVRAGEWEQAQAAVRSVQSLDLDPSDRDLLLGVAAMLAVLRGDEDDEQLAEFRALVDGREGRRPPPIARDVEILEAQFRGDFSRAYRVSVEVAQADELNAPSFYERAARAALWMGDLAAAQEAGRALRALRRSAPLPAVQLAVVEAAILALDGRREEAAAGYRHAARRYGELRMTFDRAVTRVDEARALGVATAEGAAAAAEAAETLERLGAKPLLLALAALDPTASPDGQRRGRARAAPREEVAR